MSRALLLIVLFAGLACGFSAETVTGKVIKVLPHYLDIKGQHALSPSLYERDAYQARLRNHPELRSGVRFDIEWKARADRATPLKLKVELRGIAQGSTPTQLTLEQSVTRKGWLSQWTGIPLTGEAYKLFGELSAWRVSLWDGDRLLGEQTSFLW